MALGGAGGMAVAMARRDVALELAKRRAEPQPHRPTDAPPQPPSFLAAFYHEKLSPRQPVQAATSGAPKRTLAPSPRPLGAVETQELNRRLQKRLAPLVHLLTPEAARKVDLTDPPYTEGRILSRHLLPILEAVRPGSISDRESILEAINVCFEEIARAVRMRLPDLHDLLNALHAISGGWVEHLLPIAAAALIPPPALRKETYGAEKSSADAASRAAQHFEMGEASHCSPPTRRSMSSRSQRNGACNGEAPSESMAAEAASRDGSSSAETERGLVGHASRESRSAASRASRSPASRASHSASSMRDHAHEVGVERAAESEEEYEREVNALYEAEVEAAVKLQRAHRSKMMCRKYAPLQHDFQVFRLKAIIIQAWARGKLARSAPRRLFVKNRASRCIARAWRAKALRDDRLLLKALRIEGHELTELEVDHVLEVRTKIIRLNHAEMMCVLPMVIAKHGDDIEKLKSSGQLWSGLSGYSRAKAIANHLAGASPDERRQTLNACVKTLNGSEISQLLAFILEHSDHWRLTKYELVQQILASLPADLASMAAHTLVETLVQLLPARSALPLMQRLALFSHLSPIPKMLPEASKPSARKLALPELQAASSTSVPPPSHLYAPLPLVSPPTLPTCPRPAFSRSPRVDVSKIGRRQHEA